MYRAPLLFALLLVLLAAAARAGPPGSTPRPRPAAKHSPSVAPVSQNGPRLLPGVVLRDRAGKKVPLTRYLDKKPIVLYLYSNPAEQTALDLQNLQTQMDNLSVQAVAIHGDRVRRDRAKQQFQMVAIAYPVLLDNGSVARYYGVTADPTMILVAPDGREVKRWATFIAVDKLSGELKEALRDALSWPTEPGKPGRSRE